MKGRDNCVLWVWQVYYDFVDCAQLHSLRRVYFTDPCLEIFRLFYEDAIHFELFLVKVNGEKSARMSQSVGVLQCVQRSNRCS